VRPSRFDEEGVGLQVDAGGDGGRFEGFPSSGLATPVPNLFFSRVLPRIERPEELAVSLYFFFAQTLKRRSPRFLTRRELAADGALLRSLAALSGGEDGEAPSTGSGQALERGLLLAVERGTLFRATVEIGGGQEELYLVNTPANRRAAEELAGADLRLEEPLPPAASAEPPNIFVLYEENVGGITPLIADELKQAEELYPAEWIREAFREAVSLNKRSWRYIQRILERWEAEGPSYEKAGRDPEIEWFERRYREGKRRLSSRRA
jgi:DnaD/phage-associated family protein